MSRLLLFRSAALLSSRTPQCFWRRSGSGSRGEGVQSEKYIWVRDHPDSTITNEAVTQRLQSFNEQHKCDITWDHEETFSFSSIKLRGSKEGIKHIAESLNREFGPRLTQLYRYRSPFEKPDDIKYFIDVTVTLNLYPGELQKNAAIAESTSYSTLAKIISNRGEFQNNIPQVNIIVKKHPPNLYGSVKSYSSTSPDDSKSVINVSVTHNICNGIEVGYIVQDVIRNFDLFSSYFITLDSVSSPETVVCYDDCKGNNNNNNNNMV